MLAGRIEGAVTRIGDQVGTIRQDLQEQRQDARTARVELFDQLREAGTGFVQPTEGTG